MTKFTAIMIPSQQEKPIEVSFKVDKGENVQSVVGSIIGTSSLKVVNSNIGAIMFDSEVPTENKFGSVVLSKFSSLSDESGKTFGRVIVLGEDEEGKSSSIDREKIKSLLTLYKEMTGGSTTKKDKDLSLIHISEPTRPY